MYKVVERYCYPGRTYDGNVRQTRIYQTRAAFEKYGLRYLGPRWGGHLVGTAYQLIQIDPPVWEEMKDGI